MAVCRSTSSSGSATSCGITRSQIRGSSLRLVRMTRCGRFLVSGASSVRVEPNRLVTEAIIRIKICTAMLITIANCKARRRWRLSKRCSTAIVATTRIGSANKLPHIQGPRIMVKIAPVVMPLSTTRAVTTGQNWASNGTLWFGWIFLMV